MSLSDADLAFLQDNHSAAMITVGADGGPKVARVAVALVDDRLWSSGTQDRIRTQRLRTDPRCTLYVHAEGFSWLALETTVTILEGPDVVDLTIRMFRDMQGRPDGPLTWFGGELSEEDFRATMVKEGRLLYEFDVHHSYGMR